MPKIVLEEPAKIERSVIPTPYSLGVHLIAEFMGCCRLEDPDFVEAEMVKAAIACGATVLSAEIHHFGEGFGVTGVVLLAESHISIHTWPEHNYAAIDVFVCGSKVNPQIAIKHLEESFKAVQVGISKLQRGFIAASQNAKGL